MKLRSSALWFMAIVFSLSTRGQTTTGLPKALIYDKSGNATSTTTISDFDNPVIVITYAKGWCEKCTVLIDSFDKKYATLAVNSKVKLVAISVEKGLWSSDVAGFGKRWNHVEVMNDRENNFQNAMYTTRAPRIFFMDGNQQVVYCAETYNLDVKKAYKLADGIKNGEISAANPYFDSAWFPCKASEAVYYRKVNKKSNGNWQVMDYYKSGKLQMETEAIVLFPLVKQGPCIYYTESGTKSTEENYVDGQLEGRMASYSENGAWYEANYLKGLLDGKYSSYYKNGKISSTGNYSSDKKTGIWISNYDNGKKKAEALWDNGKMEGKTIGWYRSGKLKFEAQYTNDVLQYSPAPKWLYEDGTAGFDYSVNSSSVHTLRYFYPGGKLMEVVEFNDNLTSITAYYENGQLKTQMNLTVSDRTDEGFNGKIIYFYDNGQKMAESSYQKGIPAGRAMAWYQNGKAREKIDFDTNTREYFNEQGQTVQNLPKYFFSIKKGEYLDTSEIEYELNWIDHLIKDDQ